MESGHVLNSQKQRQDHGGQPGSDCIGHNPEYHARTKHIDVQYYFVRECVEMGKVRLVYCLRDETSQCAHKALGKGQALEPAWKDGAAIDGGVQ
jgi:hypothetical protein